METKLYLSTPDGIQIELGYEDACKINDRVQEIRRKRGREMIIDVNYPYAPYFMENFDWFDAAMQFPDLRELYLERRAMKLRTMDNWNCKHFFPVDL